MFFFFSNQHTQKINSQISLSDIRKGKQTMETLSLIRGFLQESLQPPSVYPQQRWMTSETINATEVILSKTQFSMTKQELMNMKSKSLFVSVFYVWCSISESAAKNDLGLLDVSTNIMTSTLMP